jgi:hypothetical protein
MSWTAPANRGEVLFLEPISVADRLRRGDLIVDFRAGTVAMKSPPNDMS